MNYSNKNSQEIESSIYNLEKKASNINIKIKEINSLENKKRESKALGFRANIEGIKAIQENNYLKKGVLEKDLKIKLEKLKKKKKVLIFILYIIILIFLTLLAITIEINLIK